MTVLYSFLISSLSSPLLWGGTSTLDGGVPQPWMGGTPTLDRGTPTLDGGLTPLQGVLHLLQGNQTLDGGYPISGGYTISGGYPISGGDPISGGYPISRGVPHPALDGGYPSHVTYPSMHC